MEPQNGIDVLKWRLDQVEKETIETRRALREEARETRTALLAEIKEIKDELDRRSSEEKSRLLWGIAVLGSAVMALAGVIWNWRGVIFRGSP